MKKKMALFMGMITVGAFSVGAATGMRVTATYKQQQIRYNGSIFNKPVIEYGGKNYVSIRDVSDIVGVDIWYDRGIVYMEGGTSSYDDAWHTDYISPDYSKDNPAPVGVSQSVIVNKGGTSYELEMCVKETIRGALAWKQIKASHPKNAVPRDDQEYIMARISIQAMNLPGNKKLSISPEQFGLYSETDMEYGPLSVKAPSPRLNGTLKAGGTIEGWACFMVDKTDAEPKIGYLPTEDGQAQAWFKL